MLQMRAREKCNKTINFIFVRIRSVYTIFFKKNIQVHIVYNYYVTIHCLRVVYSKKMNDLTIDRLIMSRSLMMTIIIVSMLPREKPHNHHHGRRHVNINAYIL